MELEHQYEKRQFSLVPRQQPGIGLECCFHNYQPILQIFLWKLIVTIGPHVLCTECGSILPEE